MRNMRTCVCRTPINQRTYVFYYLALIITYSRFNPVFFPHHSSFCKNFNKRSKVQKRDQTQRNKARAEAEKQCFVWHLLCRFYQPRKRNSIEQRSKGERGENRDSPHTQ